MKSGDHFEMVALNQDFSSSSNTRIKPTGLNREDSVDSKITLDISNRKAEMVEDY